MRFDYVYLGLWLALIANLLAAHIRGFLRQKGSGAVLVEFGSKKPVEGSVWLGVELLLLTAILEKWGGPLVMGFACYGSLLLLPKRRYQMCEAAFSLRA